MSDGSTFSAISRGGDVLRNGEQGYHFEFDFSQEFKGGVRSGDSGGIGVGSSVPGSGNFGGGLPGVRPVPPPVDDRRLDELERRLDEFEVAVEQSRIDPNILAASIIQSLPPIVLQPQYRDAKTGELRDAPEQYRLNAKLGEITRLPPIEVDVVSYTGNKSAVSFPVGTRGQLNMKDLSNDK
jgi:hypothetical protein